MHRCGYLWRQLAGVLAWMASHSNYDGSQMIREPLNVVTSNMPTLADLRAWTN